MSLDVYKRQTLSFRPVISTDSRSRWRWISWLLLLRSWATSPSVVFTSHVVVKTKDGTLPDRTFEEAGNLAAFYSKGRTAPKVEIDYLQKKNVKKPAGAKPGFVVYYTNYSLMASPDIAGIQQLS